MHCGLRGRIDKSEAATSIVYMFEPGDSRVWREKPLPLPCRVQTSLAFPRLAHGATRADKLPLWLRTGGVQLEDLMDGELQAWARLTDGQWLARVRIRPRVGDGFVSMTLWVTADAVQAWPPAAPASAGARPAGSGHSSTAPPARPVR